MMTKRGRCCRMQESFSQMTPISSLTCWISLGHLILQNFKLSSSSNLGIHCKVTWIMQSWIRCWAWIAQQLLPIWWGTHPTASVRVPPQSTQTTRQWMGKVDHPWVTSNNSIMKHSLLLYMRKYCKRKLIKVLPKKGKSRNSSNSQRLNLLRRRNLLQLKRLP